MIKETDLEYFRRRIDEERDRAEHAQDPASYRIHTEFARHYERKLEALIVSRPPQHADGHALS